MGIPKKILFYAGFALALLTLKNGYTSADDGIEEVPVVEEDDQNQNPDPELTLSVKPFPKIGPIHRGFQRNDDTFSLIVMGQGKRAKKPLFPCFGTMGPGSYGIARIRKMTLVNGDDHNNNEPAYEAGEYQDPITFPMPRADLDVGRAVFDGLEAGTTYEVNIGYVTGDMNAYSNDTPPNFSNAHTMMIETPSANLKTITSFIYGSCARIGKIGPLVLWQDDVNRILQAMSDDIDDHRDGVGTDAVITLGDFPYMDPTGEFMAAKDLKSMHKRVQLLYGTDGARSLMQKTSIWQMRDDHEFWNNVVGDPPKGRRSRARDAQKIYDLFQRQMGSETETNYQVVEESEDAFICDTRSERKLSTGASEGQDNEPQFMSKDQIEALKEWLLEDSRKERIKPVFFSAPVFMLQTDDTFWHYKEQLSDFLNWVKENKIKYLFFGTGDIHIGKTGLWQFEKDDDDEEYLFILENASSAFYKIDHNKDNLLTDQFDLSKDGGPRLSAKGGLSPTVVENHFTRAVLDHGNHTVQIIKSDSNKTILSNVLYNLEDGTYNNVKDIQKDQVVHILNDDEDDDLY